jgi:integral membrane protein (TIGR01906 family)
VLISGLASIAVLGTLGLVVLTGFDAAFERFHLIAFDNDLWQLDPDTDRLIQMFPEGFWYDVTLWVAVATSVELIALAIGSAAILRMTREERMRTVKITGDLPSEGEGAQA